MATEAPGAVAPGRPRPLLLVALAVVAVLFVVTQFWPASPAPAPPLSRVPPAPQASGGAEVAPEDLHVRLDALKERRPGPSEADRDPFRFQPKEPPPPPPQGPAGNAAKGVALPDVPPGPPPPPPGPPPPPPITLKFMGTVEGPFGKLAAFTDCRRTFSGKEGDIIDGRYRLVKIGVESVVLQYIDGRGTQTIRVSGQDCVGK